jgi:hypothetical protein
MQRARLLMRRSHRAAMFWKLSCKLLAALSGVLPADELWSSWRSRVYLGPLSTRELPSLGPETAAPLQSSAIQQNMFARPTAFLGTTTYRLIDIMWVGYRSNYYSNQRHIREKRVISSLATCTPIDVQRHCLHIQGWKLCQASNQCALEFALFSGCWFLVWLTFRPWNWREYIPPKRRWTSTHYKALYPTAVRTSDGANQIASDRKWVNPGLPATLASWTANSLLLLTATLGCTLSIVLVKFKIIRICFRAQSWKGDRFPFSWPP